MLKIFIKVFMKDENSKSDSPRGMSKEDELSVTLSWKLKLLLDTKFLQAQSLVLLKRKWKPNNIGVVLLK